MATKLSSDDFQKWLTAPEVVTRLKDLGSRLTALSALADRLKAGLVGSAAEHRTINLGAVESGPVEIPKGHWNFDGVAVDDVWETAQFTIWVQSSERYEKERRDYFGVRFDPDDIEAMLAAARKQRPPASPQQALASRQPEKYQRKGHVTDTQMKAWYAAFKAVYGGTARDVVEPFELDSARGFFQDKEVSREDVRKAMSSDGPRTPGPKITKA